MKKTTKAALIEFGIPLLAAFLIPGVAKLLEKPTLVSVPQSKKGMIFLAVIGYVVFILGTVALIRFGWRVF